MFRQDILPPRRQTNGLKWVATSTTGWDSRCAAQDPVTPLYMILLHVRSYIYLPHLTHIFGLYLLQPLIFFP